ncbi:MAG: oligosaccharide flippase family protein [Mangrovibacterium sp.]
MPSSFLPGELGLYSRANMFKNIVSSTIGDIVGKISFPVLSTLQSEPERLLANYKKLLTSASFITLIILITIAASAESLVLALIGEQWTDSIIYLQLLCFAGIFYPLHAMTRTLLFVHGRSKMFLKLQVATKLLTVPAIIIGIFMGIVPLIIE